MQCVKRWEDELGARLIILSMTVRVTATVRVARVEQHSVYAGTKRKKKEAVLAPRRCYFWQTWDYDHGKVPPCVTKNLVCRNQPITPRTMSGSLLFSRYYWLFLAHRVFRYAGRDFNSRDAGFCLGASSGSNNNVSCGCVRLPSRSKL